MSVDITMGTRAPAHATALGQALRDAGAQGYPLVDEELEQGLRSIAVPARDRTGTAVAAADNTMHAAAHTREECVDRLLPALRQAAESIEADLHMAARFTHVPLT